MTERHSKPGKAHIARTGNTAREMWKLISGKEEVQVAASVQNVRIVRQVKSVCLWSYR